MFRGLCVDLVETSGNERDKPHPKPGTTRTDTCVGSTFTVPTQPVKGDIPSCVGQIAGITLDGVELWNTWNPESVNSTGLGITSPFEGVDVGMGYFHEPVDRCSGHPGPFAWLAYHYHKIPAFGLGDEGKMEFWFKIFHLQNIFLLYWGML